MDPFLVPPAGKLEVSSGRGGEAGKCALSLIIPAFNEARSILPLLAAIRTTLDPLLGSAYEAIVVDDDSPDETWRVASEFASGCPQVRVMRRFTERGLSSAVIRGWQVSRGNLLATINADLQHPPSLLGEMLESAKTADVVVATRFGAGGSVGRFPLHRQILSAGAKYAGKLLLPAVFNRVTDPLSGFYMLRRTVIENIELRPAGFKTLIEVLARGRVGHVSEVGYSMGRRQHGRSNMRLRHWLDYLIQLARIRAELARRPS